MSEFLKKYWFVALVGIAFLVGIVAVSLNSAKQIVSSKTVDQKSVVFSINDKNYFSSDVYQDNLNSTVSLIASKFEDFIANETIQLSDDEKTEVKLNTESTISNFKTQVGSEKVANQQLDQILKASGYQGHQDLQLYFETQLKKQKLMTNYIESHKEIFTNFQNETKARFVSHILIASTDEQPTQEVQDSMAKVDEALKTKSFADVAKEFSTDGSASNGGALTGITTTKTNFVPEFLDAALKLKEGEVSDWVKSQFGYHKITVTDSSYETMSKDASFLQTLLQYDQTIYGKAFALASNSLNIEMDDETLKKLESYYQISFKEVK